MRETKEKTPATVPGNGVKLLTTQEKAKELRVNLSTMYRWRAAGIGPEHVRVGPKLVRYFPQDHG